MTPPMEDWMRPPARVGHATLRECYPCRALIFVTEMGRRIEWPLSVPYADHQCESPTDTAESIDAWLRRR